MTSEESKEIFRSVASHATDAVPVECKPLRPNAYADNGKSVVSLVKAENRVEGIHKAVELIGGLHVTPAKDDRGYVLVKPNCNSHDPFPASTHPQTIRTILKLLLQSDFTPCQIVLGDMSGPAWLPTRTTMERNGTLNVAEEFGVRLSFFENEDWVWIRPEKAASWSDGFRIAKTAYEAASIISLPCLKTHQFGGVFTLSLKNTVGLINPADRSLLHQKMGERIAEINLAYSPDIVILDGLECFVSGGPAHGVKKDSGVIVAGGDRVSVDAVGVSVLKWYGAEGIANVKLRDHDQLRRAEEINIGCLRKDSISLKPRNMTGDEEFDQVADFVQDQLSNCA
ncbi:MAG: DUF362 domain-containing protein [Candidatus Bathyarchaeota archaeon]|nr:MAG: DUF362 domain-containing protein [Candidatus Bathyarchaeota archaeon]